MASGGDFFVVDGSFEDEFLVLSENVPEFVQVLPSLPEAEKFITSGAAAAALKEFQKTG